MSAEATAKVLGLADAEQAEYADASHPVDSTPYQLPDGRKVIGRDAYEAETVAAIFAEAAAEPYDHEAFLEDKDAISGLDVDPDDVAHIVPAAGRPALCLEVTGSRMSGPEFNFTSDRNACRDCLAIAERLQGLDVSNLARLAAGVSSNVPVIPTRWELGTQALPVREITTREIVAVRLMVDLPHDLSAIKADLWQEIRAERRSAYAALCFGDLAAAYAAT